METKRQLREQICNLNHRIEDLEERLCPYESHQWKLIEERTTYGLYGYDTVYIYKCTHCGKKINTHCQMHQETSVDKLQDLIMEDKKYGKSYGRSCKDAGC